MFSVISTFNTLLKNPKENLELRLKVIDNLTKLAISENNNSSRLEKKLRSQYINKINFQEKKIKSLQDQIDDLEDELDAIEDDAIEDAVEEGCDECQCCCDCNDEITFELTIYSINKLNENHNYETLYNYLKVNTEKRNEFIKVLRDYQKVTSKFTKVLDDLIERINNPFWSDRREGSSAVSSTVSQTTDQKDADDRLKYQLFQQAVAAATPTPQQLASVSQPTDQQWDQNWDNVSDNVNDNVSDHVNDHVNDQQWDWSKVKND
jgi:polyribonucleotide nucleotidyltransferase